MSKKVFMELSNVFPDEVIQEIHQFNSTQSWGIDSKNRLYSDLNHPFFTDHCVQLIKNATGEDLSLYRAYRNAYWSCHTPKLHFDTHEGCNRTFLLFAHDHWDNTWGGETTFGDNEEIYIKPVPNTAVHFSSEHWAHNVRNHDPRATTPRITYVWKLNAE